MSKKYKLLQPKSQGAPTPPRAERYGLQADDDAYVLVSKDDETRLARLRILERTSHNGKTVYVGTPDEPWLFGYAERVRFQPIHVTTATPFARNSVLNASDGVVEERVGLGGVLIGLAFLAAGVVAAIRAD